MAPHRCRVTWTGSNGSVSLCQGPGNVLSSGPLCLAFGRAEAGSVVPWEVCTCVLSISVCQVGVLASLSLQNGDSKGPPASGEPGEGARGQGPSPATGWEGLKQVGAATIRKAIGPQGGPSQVLGMGAQGWESEEEGPPGGTLVFLEHLGVRLLPQCAGSQGAGMVTEAGAPAPAHS